MFLYENRVLRRNDVISEFLFLEEKQSSSPTTEDVPETGKIVEYVGEGFHFFTRLSSRRFQVLTFSLICGQIF